MLALVAAPAAAARIDIREVDEPAPLPDEAVLEVRAVSLNRGEVRTLLGAEDGWRPGWDVAGVVLRGAADGSGPREGSRVVGLVRGGGWAQQVAVKTTRLAPLPEGVGFAAASALPVAGLTALRAIEVGGAILGRRVLVTGAAGGVGRFAVQLAAMGGAHVTAVVGGPERAAGLHELGADEIVFGLGAGSPSFDLILESVGGASLAAAFGRIAAGGMIVSYGNSSREPTQFDVGGFYGRSGARLYAFVLFPELERRPSAARDLEYLASLVAKGRLDPQISSEGSWLEARPALEALMERRIAGKAVLRID